MFPSDTRVGLDLPVFPFPGSNAIACCGLESPVAKTPLAGVTAICCPTEFDPCSPESPDVKAGRRPLKPIQQAISIKAATPRAASHRPLNQGTPFARFDTAHIGRVNALNVLAHVMTVSSAGYVARFVAAAGTDGAGSLRPSSL